ncbi:Uncharacterised protein [Mycobacteroides abscessus subsp. massiliense]|nr:Uncharacterised protein [Mycobacteroides abscessus subsp. massiliense]
MFENRVLIIDFEDGRTRAAQALRHHVQLTIRDVLHTDDPRTLVACRAATAQLLLDAGLTAQITKVKHREHPESAADPPRGAGSGRGQQPGDGHRAHQAHQHPLTEGELARVLLGHDLRVKPAAPRRAVDRRSLVTFPRRLSSDGQTRRIVDVLIGARIGFGSGVRAGRLLQVLKFIGQCGLARRQRGGVLVDDVDIDGLVGLHLLLRANLAHGHGLDGPGRVLVVLAGLAGDHTSRLFFVLVIELVDILATEVRVAAVAGGGAGTAQQLGGLPVQDPRREGDIARALDHVTLVDQHRHQDEQPQHDQSDPQHRLGDARHLGLLLSARSPCVYV